MTEKPAPSGIEGLLEKWRKLSVEEMNAQIGSGPPSMLHELEMVRRCAAIDLLEAMIATREWPPDYLHDWLTRLRKP